MSQKTQNEIYSMVLIEELKKLLIKLDEERVSYALCGGLAMAVYSYPRATIDIDLMIVTDDLERVKDIAKELGFSLDTGLMKFKKGAIQIYRLCKITKNPSEALILDLLMVTPEIQNVWETRKQVEWEHGLLSVISPEGLIQMKSLRGSGKDKDDIKHLKKILK